MANAVLQGRQSYKVARDNSELKHIPGNYGWPLIGIIPGLLHDQLGLAKRYYDRYGPVSRIQFGPQKGVLVLGPDLMQHILLDQKHNFSTEKGYEKTLRPFFGRGLLQSDFEEHRMQRRILQSGFKTGALHAYIEVINAKFAAGLDDWPQNQLFLFNPAIKQLLLKTAIKVFYGVDESDTENRILANAFLNCLQGQMGMLRLDLPGLKYHRGRQGRRQLAQYISELIPQRRRHPGTDMLSHMCSETKPDGSLFSDREIIDHAGFLLFAAHDTTTSALTHMVYYLAAKPEWQTRLRQAGHRIGRSEPEFDDLTAMEELDWFFTETLRLHPSAQVMVRRTIDECELAGQRVPANTMLFLMPAFNMRMPSHWREPDTFDPERFSPAHHQDHQHPFAYMAFGGGAHKCIGMHFARMQAKLFVHQLLQRFDVELPEHYRAVFKTLPMPGLKDGLPIRLAPRPAGLPPSTASAS